MREQNTLLKIIGVKGAEQKTHIPLLGGLCAMNVQKKTENILKSIIKNMETE